MNANGTIVRLGLRVRGVNGFLPDAVLGIL